MFTFYVLLWYNKKLPKLEISRSLLGVRMEKSGPLKHARLANHTEGFRIANRREAGGKKKHDLFIIYTQEPITRSVQLPHTPVTAFSQTDHF